MEKQLDNKAVVKNEIDQSKVKVEETQEDVENRIKVGL